MSKKKFKEINFVNKSSRGFQFDCVSYQDLLQKKPDDHSQFEFHRLSFYGILLCTDKVGVHNVNFQDYKLKEGTLLTLRKDNVHKFYSTNAKGILLVFTENFVLSYSNKIQATKAFQLFNEMLASPRLQLNNAELNEINALMQMILAEYKDAQDDHSANILRSLLQVIITKLFRIKSQKNIVFSNQKHLAKFLELQAHVEKECFQHKTVAYYAKAMGVTTKTLNNITQNIIEKSAKSFIIQIVITHSKRLIINSTDSLTEIAFQTGFEDPTNFFKYFKKYAGLSPREFRESNLPT